MDATGAGFGVGFTFGAGAGFVDFANCACFDLLAGVFAPFFVVSLAVGFAGVLAVTFAFGLGVGVGVGTTRGLEARGSGVGLPIMIMVGLGFGGCACAVNLGVGHGVPDGRCVDLFVGAFCGADFGATRCGIGATGMGPTGIGVGVGLLPLKAENSLSERERVDEPTGVGVGCALAELAAAPFGIGMNASLPPPNNPSCGGIGSAGVVVARSVAEGGGSDCGLTGMGTGAVTGAPASPGCVPDRKNSGCAPGVSICAGWPLAGFT